MATSTTTNSATTIYTGTPSTRNFRTTSSLQTKRHTVASVTLGQEGFADTNEARYWTQKLGIGHSKKYSTSQEQKKYAFARQLYIPPFHRREAIVQQVLFGPLLSSKHPPFAVVSGPRVNLYGTSTTGSAFIRALYQSGGGSNSTSITRAGDELEPDRSVQTGGNLALSSSFRNDGRLLAVGTEAGQARICDVTMRATLTTFSANQFAIRSLQWLRNGQYIFAAGDDGVARIWDLGSTEKTRPMVSLVGHGDVIRCTALWQEKKKKTTASTSSNAVEWTQLAATGSYDHTIRVWNIDNVDTPDANEKKEGRCLATLTHGAPVEAVCFLKSSDESVPMWLLSAGGTNIKVWNPLSGQCYGTFTTHHRKTITCVLPVLRTNYEDDETKTTKKVISMRIMTASLDGVVQIHSWNAATGTMRHLYSTKLTDSITSVAADKTGDRFAFGTVSGHVLFKMKGPNVTDQKRKAVPKAGTYSFFQRGMNAEAGTTATDYTVATSKTKKQRKLNKYNHALKKFRYAEALDEVLSTRNPKNIAGVLEELGKRRGLTHALSNRDEETLEPLLRYVTRYIKKPNYTSVLVGVAHILIDIYGDVAGESEEVDGFFRKLRHQIKLECKAQKSLMFLVGQIESSM